MSIKVRMRYNDAHEFWVIANDVSNSKGSTKKIETLNIVLQRL